MPGRSVCRSLLLAALVLGCRQPKPPVVAPAPQPGCLREAPPKESAVSFAGPPECPERYVGCLHVADALALERNIQSLRRYAREAWARCGVRPSRPEPK